MTHRERWIVYPLLFLALGLAFKSSVVLDELEKHHLLQESVAKLEADVIRCNRIEAKFGAIDQIRTHAVGVMGPNGKPGIMMAMADEGQPAMLSLFSGDGHPVVILGSEASTKSGIIETRAADGKLQTSLKSLGTEGILTLFSPESKSAVIVGRDGKGQVLALQEGSSAPKDKTGKPASRASNQGKNESTGNGDPSADKKADESSPKEN